MICPNCRSEIGRQPTCPYCGMVMAGQYDYGGGEYVVTQSIVTPSTNTPQLSNSQQMMRRINRMLDVLDLRSRLSLVLVLGIFALQLLLFILLLVK